MDDLVDNYRIKGVLGSGGMGTVYRAEHGLLDRPVAIKVLSPEFVKDRDMVARFFQEARTVSSIQHPGIVEVFDVGFLDDGRAYFAMELLSGQTLTERCRLRGRLGELEALTIVRGIASALAAAHAKGIVHRDIKPDNVFLVPDDDIVSGERVKLLDFGIAKMTRPTDALDLTRSWTVVGTPSYMAPEQCRGGGPIDHRADLYSIGCLLFELLVGRPPFMGGGPGEVLAAHQHLPAPSLRLLVPSVSVETADLVAALLEKQPGQRVASARALIARIDDRIPRTTRPTHACPTVHMTISETPARGATATLAFALAPFTAPGINRRATVGRAIAASLVAAVASLAVALGISGLVNAAPSDREPTAASLPIPMVDAVTVDARALDAATPGGQPTDAKRVAVPLDAGTGFIVDLPATAPLAATSRPQPPRPWPPRPAARRSSKSSTADHRKAISQPHQHPTVRRPR